MPDQLDVPIHRYRCTACGNLTRFEVIITRRTRGYYHFTIGGDLNIEDPEVLDEKIESVVCRWCGTGNSVVEIDLEPSLEPISDI